MSSATPSSHRSGLSWIDVVPILPPKTSIFASNLFWPGLLTAVVSSYLFFTNNSAEIFFRIVAYYIVCMAVIMFYLNSGSHKKLLAMAYAAGLTALILLVPQIFGLFVFLFKQLPGLAQPPTASFAPQFAYNFVVAGLMEELIKATPALIGLVLGLILASKLNAIGRIVAGFSVRSPMDGMLMGLAAGGSFTLVETLEHYIPKVRLERARMIEDAASAQAATLDPQTVELLLQISKVTAEKAGISDAFFLLMPRILGSLAGHMAYAAVFGYFIGLAALRRKGAIVLLATGWIAAAALHAAWNASTTAAMMLLLGVSSFLALLIYFLKARAIPTGSDL